MQRIKTRTATQGLIVSVVLLSGSLLALAQPGPGDGMHGRWWADPQIAERLGLTSRQAEEIEAIVFDAGERMIDLKAQHDKAQLELQRLLNKNDVDAAAVDRAVGRLSEAQCAIAGVETRSRIEIALLLDRDQRARLMRRFEERDRRRQSRMLREERRRRNERRENAR